MDCRKTQREPMQAQMQTPHTWIQIQITNTANISHCDVVFCFHVREDFTFSPAWVWLLLLTNTESWKGLLDVDNYKIIKKPNILAVWWVWVQQLRPHESQSSNFLAIEDSVHWEHISEYLNSQTWDESPSIYSIYTFTKVKDLNAWTCVVSLHRKWNLKI